MVIPPAEPGVNFTSLNYVLIGSISARVDASKGMPVRYYQVDLRLLSLADNRVVWTGEKKISKEIPTDNTQE